MLLDNIYFNILTPIILAIITNFLIYYYKIYDQGKNMNKFLPPGYIIAIIWIILLGLLGYIHYLLRKLQKRESFTSLFVIFLVLFCIAYPAITGLKKKNSYLLNLLTLIFSFILGLLIISESTNIFLYLIPLLIWASYVNIVFAI